MLVDGFSFNSFSLRLARKRNLGLVSEIRKKNKFQLRKKHVSALKKNHKLDNLHKTN